MYREGRILSRRLCGICIEKEGRLSGRLGGICIEKEGRLSGRLGVKIFYYVPP